MLSKAPSDTVGVAEAVVRIKGYQALKTRHSPDTQKALNGSG